MYGIQLVLLPNSSKHIRLHLSFSGDIVSSDNDRINCNLTLNMMHLFGLPFPRINAMQLKYTVLWWFSYKQSLLGASAKQNCIE